MTSKKIVLPGEQISTQKNIISSTFSENGISYASVIGNVDEEGRYVPLVARYRPMAGDLIIGIVIDIRHAGYEIDIHLPSAAFISTRETRLSFELGDIVIGKITEVDEIGEVEITDIEKLPKGKLIEFPPAKIPRLIGRKSSMLSIIQKGIGDIEVGNNGYIWVHENSNIPLALKIVQLIDKKAHMSGLTNEVSAFLEKETLQEKKGEL